TFREAEDGLPFRYFFAGPDGSFAYKDVDKADVGEPDMQLDPGFAVAVGSEGSTSGARYGVTNRGLWSPVGDLWPVRPFAFRGRGGPEGWGGVPFAGVAVDRANVLAKPGVGPPIGSKARFEVVPFLEESSGPRRFTRIGEGEWVA